MKYANITEGVFVSRPNRFIAEIDIDGKTEICHVKNTGRCKELLIPGVRVYVQKSTNPNRKTQYDLISVYKDDKLFNIDSTAPNVVFGEWVTSSGYFGKPELVKPESRYKNSRFDFYIETETRKIYAEVKGVTLESDGVLMFPDAPTERGVKHITELCECVKEGYEAYAVFVVQTDYAKYFTPNAKTHKAFSEALAQAEKYGVKLLCLNCDVTADSLSIKDFVDIRLSK